MKVLHVIPSISSSWGGTSFALRNVVSVERLAGLSPSVLACDSPDSIRSEFAPTEVMELPRSFPSRFHRSAAANSWLRKNLGAFQHVAIHGVWSFLPVEAAVLARRLGVPYSIRPHGSLDPFDLQKKAVLKRLMGPLLLRPVLDGAQFLLCTSTIEAEKAITYGSRVDRRCLYLPVGGGVLAGDRSSFRKSIGVGPNHSVILFLGRIDYKKGLNLLVEAMSLVGQRFPEAILAVAGVGPHRYVDSMKRLASSLCVAGQIRWLGFLAGKRKADAIAGSDVFALPSKNENFGVAVVEALAAGLPVLVSNNVYIHPEVVPAAGWLCEHNLASVQASLEHILSNPQHVRERAACAKEVARRFRPEVLAPLYERLYQEQ